MKHLNYRQQQVELALAHGMNNRRNPRPKRVRAGLVYVEVQSASQVIYCANCKGPVINSSEGRWRHSQKNALCAAAMKG